MRMLAALVGIAMLFVVLWDAFETIVLPRRVTRKLRLARLFYRSTWIPWAAFARLLPNGKRRESFLGFFGPLSLIFLLVVWAVGLMLSFGLLYWAAGSAVRVTEGTPSLSSDLYLSGTTFFTLGIGDVTPRTPVERVLVVVEAGMGFGFLAIVIGYLPVIYQGFSKREVNISLLDARAGSPPTAGELLRRHSYPHGLEALHDLFRQWELWSAELLESHLSYPVLAYFRSQHNNQSWLQALTTILDACALVMAGLEGACERQAELTFAMARHAVVDLAQVFGTPPHANLHNRLPPAKLAHLRSTLASVNMILHDGPAADKRLAELRLLYEPYVDSLAQRLSLTLPEWMPESKRSDNWQTSAWDRALQTSSESVPPVSEEEHF